MCDACGGRSWDQVLDRFRALKDEHGWALVQVEPDGPGHPGFTYTVGLHQFDGHPELLVSGDEPDVPQALNDMGAQVREGWRFAPGDQLMDCSCHPAQMIEVADPRRLAVAQELMGSVDVLVPALQLVTRDARNRWPWQRGWSDPGQEHFGRPGEVPRPWPWEPRKNGEVQRPRFRADEGGSSAPGCSA